jgi:hypothetical protein
MAGLIALSCAVCVHSDDTYIPMKISVFDLLRNICRDIDKTHRSNVCALTVTEVEELRNIFALLLLGSFVGLPSPPSFLAVELLPYMQKELEILSKRAQNANDMFAEMFGALGVG